MSLYTLSGVTDQAVVFAITEDPFMGTVGISAFTAGSSTELDTKLAEEPLASQAVAVIGNTVAATWRGVI